MLKKIERQVYSQAKAAGILRVCVAVSGGADSVATLASLRSVPGLNITALHCNFHLRGEASDNDQIHVERLCRGMNVPLQVKHFDVDTFISLHKGVSVEMACRELRHNWFREFSEEWHADRIATGHNADDNAETLLLNLLRGSGTAGLKGMLADNGIIWRPLLRFSRKEILKYLEESGLSYVTDATNLESDYRRNFLRNEILPMLRQRWPGADKSLQQTLKYMADEHRVVETSVANSLPSEGRPLTAEAVLNFPAPELLVRRYIEALRPFTTTPGEIVAAMKAVKSDVRRWQLPGGSVELRGSKLRKIKN